MALTFDGYRFFGGDDEVTSRLADFGHSVRESYLQHGRMPKLDLALLRTRLFFEQRSWCKHSMEAPPAEVKRYLDELVTAIRKRVS